MNRQVKRIVERDRCGIFRGMLRNILNSGGAMPTLWCVELVPKRRNLTKADEERVLQMAKGMPSDPGQAFLWMVQVIGGMRDNREACFSRVRQRLVVFTERKKALAQARKEANESWSAHVRPVRVI
jgi:hypothetical protein